MNELSAESVRVVEAVKAALWAHPGYPDLDADALAHIAVEAASPVLWKAHCDEVLRQTKRADRLDAELDEVADQRDRIWEQHRRCVEVGWENLRAKAEVEQLRQERNRYYAQAYNLRMQVKRLAELADEVEPQMDPQEVARRLVVAAHPERTEPCPIEYPHGCDRSTHIDGCQTQENG